MSEWTQECTYGKSKAWILQATHHNQQNETEPSPLPTLGRRITRETGDRQVSIDRWVQFWSKKPIKYRQPPNRADKRNGEKKRIIRLKSTYNPPGTFEEHRRWTSAEDLLFKK
ncbi:DNA replication and repair protein RecF, partial [Striga asiatica]